MNSLEIWGISKIKELFYKIDDKHYYHSIEELFSSNKIWLYTFLAFLVGLLLTIPIIYIEIEWHIFKYDTFDLKSIIIYTLWLTILILLEFYTLFILSFKLLAYYFYHLYKINNQHKIDYPSIEEKDFVAMLTRTVMEFSHGYEENFNVNHKEVKNRDIFIIGILYKLKVVISNFILKFIAKKILTRTSLRLYTPYIASIGTGLWDAFIFYKVIKNTHYKIMVRYSILYLIRKDINYILTDNHIKAILARYYYYGEYNNNISYLLHSIYQINKFSFSKEEYLKQDILDKIPKEFIIFLFATKDTLLSIKERRLIKDINQNNSLQKLQNAFRKGDYNYIMRYVDNMLM
jgi:hypothetical protein